MIRYNRNIAYNRCYTIRWNIAYNRRRM